MKIIDSGLAAHIAQEVTALVTCWKVSRRDGVVMGFTDGDESITIDGVEYLATSGFSPTAISSSTALNVDSMDVEAMLSADVISEQDILAGLYDFAEVSAFQINAAMPGDGQVVLRTGWFGEVTLRDGQFVAEVRGITQPLSRSIGELYSPHCRAVLGDVACAVDVEALGYSGVISSVASSGKFTDSGFSGDAATYALGKVTFLSGANLNLSYEVKRVESGGIISLAISADYAIVVGDNYRIYPGCDGGFSTCRTRFANAVNFRGEPHVPGMDALLETSSTRTD